MKPLHSILNLFESLEDDGYFAITYLDKSLVQYFFFPNHDLGYDSFFFFFLPDPPFNVHWLRMQHLSCME